MATTSIYLNYDGNCEEAFNFYKAVFGGEFTYIGRFSDAPKSENYKVSEADKNRIMHVGLPIGSSLLLGSDINAESSSSFNIGNNVSIYISAETKEEADNIFKKLSAGGKVNMPLISTFWGDYFGMLTDKFGINWMIGFNERQKK